MLLTRFLVIWKMWVLFLAHSYNNVDTPDYKKTVYFDEIIIKKNYFFESHSISYYDENNNNIVSDVTKKRRFRKVFFAGLSTVAYIIRTFAVASRYRDGHPMGFSAYALDTEPHCRVAFGSLLLTSDNSLF